MTDLTFTGVTAGQSTPDSSAVSPFSGVGLTAAAGTPYVTSTVALSSTANGALSHLGIGVLSADGATYTVRGAPADVQAALRGLVFTPVQHEVSIGSTVTTGFALTASDAAGAVTNTRTSVVATAADTLPTVTDTSARQMPTTFNGVGASANSGATSFTPFAYTTISDPDAGATETTGITLTQNGVATDAVGALSGSGLTKTGIGTYSLVAGTPAVETAALQALRFTPTTPGAEATVDVALRVSDGVGAPVTALSSIGLAPEYPNSYDTSYSNEALTVYNDTAAATTTHTYATTIDAVLSNGTVVFDQSFNLPYSDPQVQAAVSQAKVSVQNAGQTPGLSSQTASNLTTLSSQITTTQTGSSTAAPVEADTDTFGPNYIGPHVVAITDHTTPVGFLYIQSGQLNTNFDTQVTTTVSRTVTTTSTDLLSQQYVITGTSAALPTATVSLVSSSAAGVEGDRASGGGETSASSFSGDGSKVLFTSTADNLTANDANGHADLFVKTLATGAVTLVDVSAAGVQSNADAVLGSISANGAAVAFSSTATNLTNTATDGTSHVYVKTLSSGALASYAGADIRTDAFTPSLYTNITGPAISPDGGFLAFQASNPDFSTDTPLVLFRPVPGIGGIATIVTGGGTVGENPVFSAASQDLVFDTNAVLSSADTNGRFDVYTFHYGDDARFRAKTLISTGSNGDSTHPSISSDGTVVAFQSTATNLDVRDTEAGYDIYVSRNGVIALADITAAGVKANGASTQPTVSGDGTLVTFQSTATNLVAGIADGRLHVYEKNLASGALTLVDATPTGAAPDGSAFNAVISPDGSHVAYTSSSTNLVTGDVNGVNDVFITPALAPPAVTAPAITGVPATETDPGGATLKPFAAATVTDTNASPTITVQLQSVAVVNGQPQNLGTGGAFAGGGFTVAGGVATFTSTSLAAVQAAVQAVSFTPSAADARIVYTISDSTGAQSIASVDVLTSVNTPPTITGTTANQPDAAGVAISPFAAAVVTDPDAGQTETVTVSFTAANGTLSGGGFTGGGGVYSFAGTVAAAQAALRALSFTPTAGQSATTAFTVSVNDGQAAATDSTTSVVATYTPSATGGGGHGVVTTPPSLQYNLTVEFQNLERALAGGADALTLGTPVYTAFQAEKLVAGQLDNGQVTLAQAEAALAHLVDGTTAVAVASYGFFTGSTPTAAGLNYLVHSGANATDLNDAYYAKFSTENRYINFAVNLATGPGAGAPAFQATYGSLSLSDAVAKAYAAVFGTPADAAKVSALLDTLVPDGLGGQETRAQYFAQYGGDGRNGQGTKAAAIGFLLSNAVHDGSGVYGAATEHYLAALAHGSAPAFGSELALTYGANVNLVGFTPVPDPSVTG